MQFEDHTYQMLHLYNYVRVTSHIHELLTYHHSCDHEHSK